MFNRKVVLLLPREVVKNKLIDYKAMRLYKPMARRIGSQRHAVI